MVQWSNTCVVQPRTWVRIPLCPSFEAHLVPHAAMALLRILYHWEWFFIKPCHPHFHVQCQWVFMLHVVSFKSIAKPSRANLLHNR